jgi:uncharacterized protein (DUF4415 family)
MGCPPGPWVDRIIGSFPEDVRVAGRPPGAANDTDEDWARARPAREILPDVVEWYNRTRGKQKRPTKVLVSLRLDGDLVETLRASGRGWQSRANAMLKKAVLGTK